MIKQSHSLRAGLRVFFSNKNKNLLSVVNVCFLVYKFFLLEIKNFIFVFNKINQELYILINIK
jgi:hypothetical protein